MGLSSFIKSFISKSKKSRNKNLVLISDFISLPTREELEKFPHKLEQVDSYKSEYWKKLVETKNVVTPYQEVDELRAKMKMYTDLIGNIINENDEYTDSFQKIMYYEEGTKRLNYKIKMAKLKLYQQEIEKLESDAILRLVALKELLEEKRFLSPKKKHNIREEIDSLCYTALVFINSKQAIFAELNSYIAEYGILDSEEFVEKEIEESLIDNKRAELKNMLEILEITNDNDTQKFSSLELAIYEKILEEYFYNHKVIEKLETEIYRLSYIIYDDTPKSDKEYICLSKSDLTPEPYNTTPYRYMAVNWSKFLSKQWRPLISTGESLEISDHIIKKLKEKLKELKEKEHLIGLTEDEKSTKL